MTNPSRNSSLGEDPLQAYSGLALFPRMLRSLSIHLPSHHQSDDLMQKHNILDSMPFEVEKELQEEAKAILDESLKQGIRSDCSICSRSSAINSEAGGTKWENGVRRSTRIKSRPLRYL